MKDVNMLPERRGYHHGDLRAALVAAGVEAARGGGESAVRLTHLATAVGVSAAAAYRHFPDGLEGLLVAVGDLARAELADLIRLRVGEVPEGPWLAERRFRASGLAYVEYVTEQPGLFQVGVRHTGALVPEADPHALLEEYLDDLVTAGVLPVSRRPYASAAAWATVHGLAVLLNEGALGLLPADERQRVVDRTLDMVAFGLLG